MEIQKAQDLTIDFGRKYDLTTDEMCDMLAILRARDKAIIERCKIKLIKCDEVGVDKYLFTLDTILRELE
jgi:hypothetical protein